MTVTVFTIGYEGVGVPALLAALRAEGVRTLIDVRELPLSRRAGFSKKPLSASLVEAGIDYLHLKALGTPKEGRLANEKGRMDEFWRIVDARLAAPEAEPDLATAGRLALERGPVCLLCRCADETSCHRIRVSDILSHRYGLGVTHLHPDPAF